MRGRLAWIVASCVLTLMLAPAAGAAALATAHSVRAGDGALVAESTPGTGIKGTLKGPDGQPVADVTITVSEDGDIVGSATTDDTGAWTVAVPSAGRYAVALDVSTLPPDVELRSAGAETLPAVTVQPGTTRTVLFPLVAAGEQEDARAGPSSSSPPTASGSQPTETGDTEVAIDPQDASTPFVKRFLQMLVEGIKLGAIIAITAVGLSLVFGTTRLINFAHGELVTIGAVVAFAFSTRPLHLPLVLATVIAVAVGALVGGGTELILWRPLRARSAGLIQMFIISIGLSLFLRHLILTFFGSRRNQYSQYTVQKSMSIGPIQITPRDLVVTLLSVLVLLGVAYMLQRTRIGKATRAVSDNSDLAEASGIDVNRVILIVWGLGGGLAALGGVFYGVTQAVYWDMGFNLLLLMFAGVILGGLGNAYGAMVGSFVVGLVAQLSTLWFPVELQNAWALLTLIVVLLVRPQGILGRAVRAG